MIEAVDFRAVRTTRDHLATELVSATLASDLDPSTEDEIRAEMARRLASLLDVTDDLVAAHVQLRAVNERLDRHVQAHDLCRIGVMQACWAWRELQRTRDAYQRHADRAMRTFLRGHR